MAGHDVEHIRTQGSIIIRDVFGKGYFVLSVIDPLARAQEELIEGGSYGATVEGV